VNIEKPMGVALTSDVETNVLNDIIFETGGLMIQYNLNTAILKVCALSYGLF
jgi:hypothetical protein